MSVIIGRLVALVIVAAVVLTAGSACSSSGGEPVVPSSPPASLDPTGQAQWTLEQFFAAWQAEDVTRFNALVDPSHAVDDFEGVSRVEFGEIRPVLQPDAAAYDDPDVHVFSAWVRFWGSDLSVEQGARLDWHWEVRRGGDGRWRVTNWGYG
jgi:hypothetical protein